MMNGYEERMNMREFIDFPSAIDLLLARQRIIGQGQLNFLFFLFDFDKFYEFSILGMELTYHLQSI